MKKEKKKMYKNIYAACLRFCKPLIVPPRRGIKAPYKRVKKG